ncbi:hypothetical protein [Carbonactinospora thermoautotrophica]|nr:hypothetical protein [Carbonactinospora thermoautotrophica]
MALLAKVAGLLKPKCGTCGGTGDMQTGLTVRMCLTCGGNGS